MKKLAKWIFSQILIPILKDLLQEVFKTILKFILDLFVQMMSKWKTEEEKMAQTEDEKEFIRKKWNDRINDIDGIKSTMDEKVDKIIEDAIKNTEEQGLKIEEGKKEQKALSS